MTNTTKSSDTLISIIVPVYNIEDYLPQCIDSLLAQSYVNIELLLVDDGSTDGSGRIADSYAKRDHRVRVFHQPNGGISSARNTGLDAMHGDYVMFVDGDDFVEMDYCKTALELALEHQVDIVAFGFNKYWPDHDKYIPLKTSHSRLMDKESAIRELIRRRDVMFNYVWNKIFARHLFDGIRFPVGRSFEDLAILYLLFDKASTGVYFSDEVLYNYRKERCGSITSADTSTTSVHDRYLNEVERMRFIHDHYPELEKSEFDAMVCACLRGLTFLPTKHKDRKEIKTFLKRNKKKCLQATYGKRKKRLMTYYYMRPLFPVLNMYVKGRYYRAD